MAKILMVTATSDNNLALAEKFADKAREMGHDADIIDLVSLDANVHCCSLKGIRCRSWNG